MIRHHPNAAAIRAGARRNTVEPQPTAIWAAVEAHERIDRLRQRKLVHLVRARKLARDLDEITRQIP